jgi:hypothetical protein
VLIELDAEDGKLISFRSLLSGFAGLRDSEPKLFYCIEHDP